MNKPQIICKNSSGFEEKSLKDVSDVKQGFPFDSSQYNKKGKFRIITISNVGGDSYIRDEENSNKICDLPEGIQGHQILRDEDILVSMTGNVGRVSKNKGENNLLNQRVDVVVPNNINKDYLFYLLSNRNFEKEMIIKAQGGAQLNISNSDIEKYKIFVPNLIEQEKISKTFNYLSNTINTKKQELLSVKRLKKTMLIKMFPQKHQSVPEIRFKNFSGNWVAKKLNKCTDILNEQEQGYKKDYISTENMLQNFKGVNKYKNLEKVKGTKFNTGDILISNIRPYLKKIWLSDFNGICSTDVIALSPVNTNNEFLYYAIANEKFVSYVMSAVKGTKMPRGDKDHIHNYELKIPEIEEQIAIGNFFKELDKNIVNKENEIEIIMHLKENLINKMFC